MIGEVRIQIICRADDFNICFLNQISRFKIFCLQQGIGLFPNSRYILFKERFFDSKEPLQFQVSPFINRIANRFFQCTCPGHHFFIFIAITGNQIFRNAVSAFQSPFIMVAQHTIIKPYPGKIRIIFIFINILRFQVTVVINNRHFFSMFMIQLFSRLISQ